jgi:hypothetical protein
VFCDMRISVRDAVFLRSDIEYRWREPSDGVSGYLRWIGADTSERIMLATIKTSNEAPRSEVLWYVDYEC